MEQIEDLGNRIRELSAEHEYSMAQTVQQYEENKKQMIDHYTLELFQLQEIQQVKNHHLVHKGPPFVSISLFREGSKGNFFRVISTKVYLFIST